MEGVVENAETLFSDPRRIVDALRACVEEIGFEAVQRFERANDAGCAGMWHDLGMDFGAARKLILGRKDTRENAQRLEVRTRKDCGPKRLRAVDNPPQMLGCGAAMRRVGRDRAMIRIGNDRNRCPLETHVAETGRQRAIMIHVRAIEDGDFDPVETDPFHLFEVRKQLFSEVPRPEQQIDANLHEFVPFRSTNQTMPKITNRMAGTTEMIWKLASAAEARTALNSGPGWRAANASAPPAFSSLALS